MESAQRGKYAKKHSGERIDERVGAALRSRATDGRIACLEACRISEELGVSLAEVGRNADLLDIRLNKCLLGLFGHASTTGRKRIIEPAQTVSEEMSKEIHEALEDGRLPCEQVWNIAARLEIPRIEVARAVEALGIRISHCQIGAF